MKFLHKKIISGKQNLCLPILSIKFIENTSTLLCKSQMSLFLFITVALGPSRCLGNAAPTRSVLLCRKVINYGVYKKRCRFSYMYQHLIMEPLWTKKRWHRETLSAVSVVKKSCPNILLINLLVVQQ